VWDYVRETIPSLRPATLGYDLAQWYAPGRVWLRQLGDTVLIAFVATLLSSAAALVLCFPASRNLVRSGVVYHAARRLLDLARGVPELVYAMIFVFAFRLGAFPGVLAIAVHSAGSLGKLFSEVNENVDPDPIQGIRSTGASWMQTMRYAVLPQVLPDFVSYSILRFEINVRAATVIGLVGAGGIGTELMVAIRQFHYTDVSAITLMIIALVAVLDRVCEALRLRLIGKEERL
jgi:phosphonate transport system permease protein